MKSKLLFPLLVLLVGCNAANKPLTETRKEAVKKEAVTVVKDFYDALINNDTAKLIPMFSKDPDMVILNTGGVFSQKEIENIARQYFYMVEKQTFVTKSENYTVIDPACFVYSWSGKNEVFIKGTSPIVFDDLMGSYTFKKTGSEWKIIHMHESVNTPLVADPVKEFTKIEEEWGDAIYRKDAKALGQIYADEYMYIDSKGKINNKQQDINEIVGPSYKALTPLKVSDINVRMYGSVAVVTGVTTSTSVLNGVQTSGSHNFMDIFTFRDGRWQCILTQYISKPQK